MLNTTQFVGRTTRPVTTNPNQTVANLTIAVDRDYKDKNGERQTDFVNVVAINNVPYILKKIGKGSLISVVGRLENHNYQKNDGQMVYTYVVVTRNIGFIDLKNSNDDNNNSNGNNGANNDGNSADNKGAKNNQNSANNTNAIGGDHDYDPFSQHGDQLDMDEDNLPF